MILRSRPIISGVLSLCLVVSCLVPVRADEPPVVPPTITAGSLVEGVGGHFDLSYAPLTDPYNQFTGWSFSIVSADGSLFYSQYDGQAGQTPPTGIDWDGTSTWVSGARPSVVMPAGSYTVTYTITYAILVPGHFWYDLPSYLRQDPITSQISVTVLPSQPVITPTPTPTPTEEMTPTPTPVSTPIPTPTPQLTVLPTPDLAAHLHPVLLIHGLTGYPDNWSNANELGDYVSLLKNWGFPEDYIAEYHYVGTGIGKDGYNNQGDIFDASAGMRSAVSSLHDISLAHGGDGQVDIIAHSMGGLIARAYMRNYPINNYIRKFIAIGTPFQGSWWMDNIDSSDKVKELLKPLVIEKLGIDLSQPAENEMTKNSSVLQMLDTVNLSTFTTSLYGNLNLKFNEKLFDLTLTSADHQIGDGVVATSSAIDSGSINGPQNTYSYNETWPINLGLHMFSTDKHDFSFILSTDTLDPRELAFFHTSLPKQPQVESRVQKILTAN